MRCSTIVSLSANTDEVGATATAATSTPNASAGARPASRAAPTTAAMRAAATSQVLRSPGGGTSAYSWKMLWGQGTAASRT